jgi:CHAT domain
VSGQFYGYLRDGYNFAEALQKAKIDLLRSPRYAQFHSPQYWSNLVYVGSPPHQSSGWQKWLLLVGGLFLAFVFVLTKILKTKV